MSEKIIGMVVDAWIEEKWCWVRVKFSDGHYENYGRQMNPIELKKFVRRTESAGEEEG